MTKFYSASEIAAMRLPGLPTTKVGIRAFAERESWRFLTKTGVGGTRKMYAVPATYFPVDPEDRERTESGHAESQSGSPPADPGKAGSEAIQTRVVGTIAAGSAKVDTTLLDLAIRALSEWEEERGIKVADNRRSAIIAVLYDYLQDTPDDKGAIAVVLRALG